MFTPTLPTDVLQQVFEYFAQEEDYSTLHSCTLVCHNWHPLANRILWRKPILEKYGEYSQTLQNLILSSPTHAHWIQEWSSRNLPADILLNLKNLKVLPETPARSLRPLVKSGVHTHIRSIRKLNSRGSELNLLIDILKLCPFLEDVILRIFAIDTNIDMSDFEQLRPMNHLVRLTIEFEDFDIGEFGARFIESMIKLTPNLKHLGLKTGTFTAHRLSRISERCPHLESLSLEYWNDPDVATVSLFVKELSCGLGAHLRHFSVIQRGGFVSPGIYQAVWPLMNSLKSLHLWGIGLNEESFKVLTESAHSLSRLTFYRSPSSDDSDMTNSVSHTVWWRLFSACASNLVELNLLAFRPFPLTVSQAISERCTNLKSLSITSESAEFVCPILRVCGPQLTSLELMGCKLGVETLDTVFQHCHSLTKLVFMHPEIGGTRPSVHHQGISRFLQKTGPKLQSLILSGTLISSQVLEEIRTHCPRLNHLDLTQVTSIEEKSVVTNFKACLMYLKWIKINGKGAQCGQKH